MLAKNGRHPRTWRVEVTPLLVAGASGELGVSDAIGALMIGLVVSQTRLRERVERLALLLRNTFTAVFFVAFGLSIDVGALGEIVVPVLLAVLSPFLASAWSCSPGASRTDCSCPTGST